MNDAIRVEARFCGPPGTANGGYLAGLIAARFDGPLEVTLRRPVPLDTDLSVQADGSTLRIRAGDQVLVDAVPRVLALDAPPAPDYQTAVDASTRYVARDRHPFPRCFVCGTERDAGDGLRIFAGPLRDRPLVAAPWVPAEELADAHGLVRDRFAWAALDCPGAYAGLIGRNPVPMVLGRIVGSVRRRVRAGDRCVVIGWPIDRDGRKHHVGTAVVDSAGEVCAIARATWFAVA